tara:strand:- start:3705 stop:4187 length:483 start_codon:yes stop_codon:yes gene_type:complete
MFLNKWFNVVKYSDLQDNEDDVLDWLEKGLNDKRYVIIDKNNYDATCDFIKNDMNEKKQKLDILQAITTARELIFNGDLRDKNRKIENLKRRNMLLKNDNTLILSVARNLREKYTNLETKCEGLEGEIRQLDMVLKMNYSEGINIPNIIVDDSENTDETD